MKKLVSPLVGPQNKLLSVWPGWCNTGTSDYPLIRLDQIWASANLNPDVARAYKTTHSDHRMVIADISKAAE